MLAKFSFACKLLVVFAFVVVLVLAINIPSLSADGPSVSDTGFVGKMPTYVKAINSKSLSISSVLGSPTSGSYYTAGTGVQTGRLFRNGIVSTCAASKAVPTIFTATGSRKYDTYTFTNNTNASACVPVTLTVITNSVGSGVWAIAYLGSYNPSNQQQNYIADSGGSTWSTQPPAAFSFALPAGATGVIVVQETDPSTTATYRLDLDVPESAPAEVPESDTLILLGGGLGGLTTWLGWQWRKMKRK